MIWTILHLIDITLWFIIGGSVAYVAFFAIISLFHDKEDHVAMHAAAISNRITRFLILYPAYNEDRVIFNAVEQFLLQDYPKDHYTVAVISDHMQEETNDNLRKLPITLLTPTFEKSSKAKAMQYAINEVKADFDNVVILDADNVVRPDFLSRLNILCTVYDAIQCHRWMEPVRKSTTRYSARLTIASVYPLPSLAQVCASITISSKRMYSDSLRLEKTVSWRLFYSNRKYLSSMHQIFTYSMRK